MFYILQTAPNLLHKTYLFFPEKENMRKKFVFSQSQSFLLMSTFTFTPLNEGKLWGQRQNKKTKKKTYFFCIFVRKSHTSKENFFSSSSSSSSFSVFPSYLDIA
jgi:hypothetical protein